jgi:hypothetical protein
MPDNKPPVAHYDRGTVQPIDFFEGSFTREQYEGYLMGNIIKYVSRFNYKGTPLDDLDKAARYLGWLIDFERKQVTPCPPPTIAMTRKEE